MIRQAVGGLFEKIVNRPHGVHDLPAEVPVPPVLTVKHLDRMPRNPV
jgi:hypothetical protein